MCTTTSFTLNGRLASVLADSFPVSGTGTAECTTDRTGATGWTPVTIAFQSESQEPLPCSTDTATGAYQLTGTFSIDGFETFATLKITTEYADPWTRSLTATFDLPDARMKSSFQIYDIYPPLSSSDPGVCLDGSCSINTQPVVTPDIGAMISQLPQPVPPLPSTAFWIQVGASPSLQGGPLTGLACYQPYLERLSMGGSLDVMLSTLEAVEYAGGTSAAYDLLPPEVKEQMPAINPELMPDLIDAEISPIDAEVDEMLDAGEELDEVVALALAGAIDTFSNAFGPAAASPGLPAAADMAPYQIRVTYKTALGSQKIETVGIMGASSPVLVPNANNNNVPEIVFVSLSAFDGVYELKIKRQSTSSNVLPIDVSILAPPMAQLQSLSDVVAEIGYKGFAVGGGAPREFVLRYTSASSDNSNEASAHIETVYPAGQALPLDIVGKYQVTSEATDLRFEIQMAAAAKKLKLSSIRTGKKRTLTYDADVSVGKISLVGTEKGKELNASLTNVAKVLRFCSDKGNGCVLPWRVYQCGCDAVETRYWHRIPIKVCTKPRYCPLAAENSASFSSTTNGLYAPTTLGLITHSPTVDASGTVVSDDVTNVNLTLAQFGFDKRFSDYPKRVYFDTRRQSVSGTFKQSTYNSSGARKRHLGVSGGFSAWNREFKLKKHKEKITGLTYYSIDKSGSMSCSGFNIDTGGELPGWVEDALEHILC